MSSFKFAVLAALGALLFQSAVNAGDRHIKIFLGALDSEGMPDEDVAAARAAVVAQFASIHVRITPEPGQGPVIENACFDNPACLRQTAAAFEADGLMRIGMIRTGSVARISIDLFDGESGLKLQAAETMAPMEGFPQSISFSEVMAKGLDQLTRNLEQAERARQAHAAEQAAAAEKAAREKQAVIEKKAALEKKAAEHKPPPATGEPKPDESANMKITSGAPAALPARHSTFKTWGIVALAAGGAAVLGGVVTGSYALALDADLSSSCPSGVCDPSQNSKIDKLDHLSLATNVLLGVGVATLIGGVVLLLVSADAPADRGALSLKPALGAGNAGLLLEGRF